MCAIMIFEFLYLQKNTLINIQMSKKITDDHMKLILRSNGIQIISKGQNLQQSNIKSNFQFFGKSKIGMNAFSFVSYSINSGIQSNYIFMDDQQQRQINNINVFSQHNTCIRQAIQIKPQDLLNTSPDKQQRHKIVQVTTIQNHRPQKQVEPQIIAKNCQKQQKQLKKKQQLKKSNAIKNFLNQFIKQFKNPQLYEKLNKRYNISQKQYKNIVDNLYKKIKYSKKTHRIQDFISTLKHFKYSLILKQICLEYLEIYPQKIQNQSKIIDKDTNFRIVEEFRDIINSI